MLLAILRAGRPSDKIKQLHHKVEELDGQSIDPLLSEISQYEAKSHSSRLLGEKLRHLSAETSQTIEAAHRGKKRQLQIDQLTNKDHPEPEKDYQQTYIHSVLLDGPHQQQLDDYVAQNTAHCKTTKLGIQKSTIQQYLGMDKNVGKKMQHIIYNHFFAPALVVEKTPQPTSCALVVSALPFNPQ